MKNISKNFKHSAGLTLIELVTSMVIASVAALGLGIGISSIVGFYQDDWVTKDVRFWGYECMDYIVDNIDTAKKVEKRQYLANFDGLLITKKDGVSLLNIQATENGGLTNNGFPLLDYADFPTEGTYKDEGQRIVALEKFRVSKLVDDEDFRRDFGAVPNEPRLTNSLWSVEMVISVTTKYQGEAFTEYMKFKRIAWAKDKYFI